MPKQRKYRETLRYLLLREESLSGAIDALRKFDGTILALEILEETLAKVREDIRTLRP